MGAALKLNLPDWPAGLTEKEALAYTGVGEEKLREWRRRGIVRFVPHGPRGAIICQRAQLDAALNELFAGNPNGPSEDFDFG